MRFAIKLAKEALRLEGELADITADIKKEVLGKFLVLVEQYYRKKIGKKGEKKGKRKGEKREGKKGKRGNCRTIFL